MWTHDVRYAFRLLRRSPAFALTATLTLALSIGANAAIWSAVNGILVAPLPYPDPDRLVRLFEETPDTPHFPMAPNDFRDYRGQLEAFDGIAAFFRADLQIGDASRPEQLTGMQASAGFFTLLGRPPALGRDFTEDDEVQTGGDVAILSHALWMRRFDGDPAIVGKSVRLSGKTYQIVGVLPPGFQHVGSTFRSYGHGEAVDVWTPLPVPRDDKPMNRYSHYYNVIARIKKASSPAEVKHDLEVAGAVVATHYPEPNSRWKPRAIPVKDEIVGTAQSTLGVLASAGVAMLLLACVNVAGLLLGRAHARTREMGVRAAIGATRVALTRQLLVESLVLTAGGAALGVVLAYAATTALARLGPQDLPRLQRVTVDATVLAITAAATLGCALVVGLAPALRLARTTMGDALKEGGRSITGGGQRTGKALAAVEVALAFVLVVSSGLLLKSFVALITQDPGFQPRYALTASVELPTARYDADASRIFYQRAAERIRAIPGIQEAAFMSDLPWTGYDENTGFAIKGRPSGSADAEARYHFVTPGFPKAAGTKLVAGEEIADRDRAGAPPVVMLNEAAARKYWPSAEAAVGQVLDLWGADRTVKGVIGDVRDMPWHDRAAPALYFPQAQTWYPQRMFLVVRTGLDPRTVVEPIRKALKEIDPELPLANVRRLDEVAASATATRRLTLWLVASFGLTALLLAVVGVYGVMAQAVGQRRQEFGVRQALGATRADIVRLVFSSAAGMTIGGLLAGLALATASTRLMMSLLYGVKPLDPTTFAVVAAVLVVAAAGAISLPALRATRVSVMTVLRTD